MKAWSNRLLSCLSAGSVLIASLPALAGPYNALYVFGDSYSDIGFGYEDGNGLTAVAYLAQDLGIPFTYAGDPNAGGKSLDFADSGAQSGAGAGQHLQGTFRGYGMLNQVRDFANLASSHSLDFDPATTLFFIAGGLNDSTLPTATTVANITSMVTTLHGLGAVNIDVALLPTQIPSFRAVGQRLDPAYTALIPQLQTEFSDLDIRLSNWGLFYDQVITNPSAYGITNTTDRCAGRAIFGEDTTPCATPDTYFYYHSGHPSTYTHSVVGDKLYQEVLAQTVPEPASLPILAGALALLACLSRRNQRALTTFSQNGFSGKSRRSMCRHQRVSLKADGCSWL